MPPYGLRLCLKKKVMAALTAFLITAGVLIPLIPGVPPFAQAAQGGDGPPPFRPRMVKDPRFDEDDNGVDDRLDDEIGSKIQAGLGGQRVRVIVLLWDDPSQRDVESAESLGGRVFAGPWRSALYGFGLEIPYQAVARLAANNPKVLLIEKDAIVNATLSRAARQVNARTYTWSTLGFRGDPQLSIAIVDTGIDDTHDDFTPGFGDQDFTKKVVGWNDIISPGTTEPYDDNYHGSHVAGIAAGVGFDPTDAQGRYVMTAHVAGSDLAYSGTPSGTYVWDGVDVNSLAYDIEVNFRWRTTNPANTNTDVRLFTLLPTSQKTSASTPDQNTFVTLTHTPDSTDFYYVASTLNRPSPFASAPDLNFNVHWPFTPPSDGFPAFTGIAPQAKLVGIKVLDSAGSGLTSGVVDGVDWAVANRATYHITVMNLSLTGGSNWSVNTAVNNAVAAGIVTVVSQGNDGSEASVSVSPAEAFKVISVAAINRNNNITSYSSSGGTVNATYSKPDIAAPGGSSTSTSLDLLKIFSADTNDNDAQGAFAEGVSDDALPLAGTSMSSPMVAGAAALVQQAMGGYDQWGYTESEALLVKSILLMTAAETYPLLREGEGAGTSPTLDRGGKDIHEGYGALNVDAAVQAAVLTSTVDAAASTSSVTLKAIGESSAVFDRHAWATGVDLTSGVQVSFTLNNPAGGDFDLYLYAPTPNSYGEPVISDSSTTSGTGGTESITFTPGVTGRYYVVVKAVSGSGAFTIDGIESGPTATASNSPDAVGTSASNDFTLTINNDASSPNSITQVVLEPSTSFTSIGATAPTDWSVTTSPTITWTKVSGTGIDPGSSLDFSWSATSPATEANYTSSWTATDSDGGKFSGTFGVQVSSALPEFPAGVLLVLIPIIIIYFLIMHRAPTPLRRRSK